MVPKANSDDCPSAHLEPNSKAVLTPAPHPIASFGDIFLPRPQAATKSLLSTDGLELTYNGRGALLRACLEVARKGKRQILLPAYHCPSGITPTIQAGLEPVFYRVRRDLTVDFEDLIAKVEAETAAVLVIHYFGVATDLQPLQFLRERGIEVIEDWSHSFLQGSPVRLSGGGGDYRIYSFWKLAPCVVGGGLWRLHGDDGRPSLAMQAPPVRERVVRLKRMLEEALNHSDYKRAKALFAHVEALRLSIRPVAEPTLPADLEPLSGESYYPFDLTLANSRMPALARRVLESCDLHKLAQKRRDNFNQYGQLLTSSTQLKVLYRVAPAETCPWVFPVLLTNRDKIDRGWREGGVALHTFGIYLHSALFKHTDSATITDATFLSEHMLCLSIHQGISAEQISSSAVIINRHMASCSVNA